MRGAVAAVDEKHAPLAPEEFAALMAPFAPFEQAPRLAIAVSGGADSLALALLVADWARSCGGSVTALTVDHRLRPEAAAEAAQVAAWLAARGIEHRILLRDGPPLAGDVQAGARAARYRLLEEWCAAMGVLHLLTAHHRGDQTETLLLQLARGTGLYGLAAMAPAVERAQCRLLRPLLRIAAGRLAATLAGRGQEWIEDPSNRNPAYARVRLRRSMEVLAAEGLDEERLAATALRLGRTRAAIEAAVAELLARHVLLHPLGLAHLDAAALRRAPEEFGLRALAALIAAIGGAEYPPRLERLERLYRRLPDEIAGGATLGGCRLLPRREGLVLCREPAAVADPVAAPPGAVLGWDGRFQIRVAPEASAGLVLGALGRDEPLLARPGDWARLPAAARASLPALRDRKGRVLAHAGMSGANGETRLCASFSFMPTRPLARAGFTVV